MSQQLKANSLAALKRRITPGTVLYCVMSTYNPAMNDTMRVVVAAHNTTFAWRPWGEASARLTWTTYPKAKGIRWLDDETFELTLD